MSVQPLQGWTMVLSVSAGSAFATLTLHRRLLMLRACGAAWNVREKQSTCHQRAGWISEAPSTIRGAIYRALFILTRNRKDGKCVPCRCNDWEV